MKKLAGRLTTVERAVSSLPAEGGVVVAVSGGADSIALLRAVVGTERGVVAAHLNHQLRGAASDADEAFVAALCDRLKAEGCTRLAFRSERLDVARRAREAGANLESEARRLRYAWLRQVAQESGCGLVVTGHSADDQAETVLHRLLRGTGLAGLRGIARRRPLGDGVELVRPLLSVTRADILEYLAQQGQDYRTDASNADCRFTRNRIRHELLPLLARDYNPAVARTLGRLAEQAVGAAAVIAEAAAQLLKVAERPRAGPLVILDSSALVGVSPYLLTEVFRCVWDREGWPAGEMNGAAWKRLIAVVQGEVHAVDLPGGVRAERRERVVQMAKRSFSDASEKRSETAV
jgi:tRNA(Ile)-lysidine synthase